jgi:hypothetical protein
VDSVSHYTLFENQEPTLSFLEITEKHTEETIWPSHAKSEVESTSLGRKQKHVLKPSDYQNKMSSVASLVCISLTNLSAAAGNIVWMLYEKKNAIIFRKETTPETKTSSGSPATTCVSLFGFTVAFYTCYKLITYHCYNRYYTRLSYSQ